MSKQQAIASIKEVDIVPGTKIMCKARAPHQCSESEYTYEKIRGTLISPKGNKVTYSMMQCNNCGVIAMRADRALEIELIYKNYEFVHVYTPKKNTSPTKRQIKNAQYVTACAVAEAQGKPIPKRNGKRELQNLETPEYVFKGEAPVYMQRNAAHPYQGGGTSPR